MLHFEGDVFFSSKGVILGCTLEWGTIFLKSLLHVNQIYSLGHHAEVSQNRFLIISHFESFFTHISLLEGMYRGLVGTEMVEGGVLSQILKFIYLNPGVYPF